MVSPPTGSATQPAGSAPTGSGTSQPDLSTLLTQVQATAQKNAQAVAPAKVDDGYGGGSGGANGSGGADGSGGGPPITAFTIKDGKNKENEDKLKKADDEVILEAGQEIVVRAAGRKGTINALNPDDDETSQNVIRIDTSRRSRKSEDEEALSNLLVEAGSEDTVALIGTDWEEIDHENAKALEGGSIQEGDRVFQDKKGNQVVVRGVDGDDQPVVGAGPNAESLEPISGGEEEDAAEDTLEALKKSVPAKVRSKLEDLSVSKLAGRKLWSRDDLGEETETYIAYLFALKAGKIEKSG